MSAMSLFTPAAERTHQPRLALADPPKPPQALTEKYRPRWLSDLYGQGAAVMRLMDYLDAPYPTAFVFCGDTGTGKTSAAVALANELGVNVNWDLHRIKSGELDQDAVNSALKCLRFHGQQGGWKVVICDEADSMSAKAKQLWLSALEDLPENSIIIFTTNHRAKFERRFLDRCEVIEFTSDASLILQDAQALFNDLWRKEGIAGDPFDVSLAPNFLDGSSVSFRRVIRAVEMARSGWRPSPNATAQPIEKGARKPKLAVTTP